MRLHLLNASKFNAVQLACYTLCCLLCFSSATSQEPLEKTAPDPPSQRRLQLPEGELPTIGEQVRLLQQLRNRVSLQPAPSPPLTEQQLQQMEQIFRRWKSESAEEFQLPNLDSIPQEWIEKAITDPKVRQQAERLLQQYAQERQNLTSPMNADRGSPGLQGEPTNRAGGAREQSTPGLNPSDRELPDAAKIKSLQELFKKLTDAETSRAQSSSNTPGTNSLNTRDGNQSRTGGNRPRNAVNPGGRDLKRDLGNAPPSSNLNRNSQNRYLPRSTDSNKPQTGASGERASTSQSSQLDVSELPHRDLSGQNSNALGANAFDPAIPDFAGPAENVGTNKDSRKKCFQ